ncbi:MAG: hypothetical protein DRQ40_03580 [Gammaproteobacteria bacterium]|nr:MAG: hypothetical protein DRQ40_03580 [Gammaproteobacteria bacterium]
MALSTSTGLRDYVLVTGPVRDAVDLGFIHIYSGIAPLTADDAIGSQGANILLVTISLDATATGLSMAATATNGTVEKDVSQIWRGTAANTGLAEWYRHVGPADTGSGTTTEPRYQGLIAQAGAELNMSDPNVVAGADQKIDFYLINLPA